MQTSLQPMHLCEKLNPNSWPPEILQVEIRNHPRHHIEGKPEWCSSEGSGSGGDWQAVSSGILDTHLHRWFSWKCHKKRRMRCLYQASRQASILCVNIWWDTVLKLQSWSPSTVECHRNHHFVGREAQESSLPHSHCQLCKPSRPANLMLASKR